jgi:hypothetical protein
MSQSSTAHNPFMLLLNPEVVLAAIEKSEHLSQLNRHLCRPLDRQTPLSGEVADDSENDRADDSADEVPAGHFGDASDATN